jgi:small subunit ribosomal protein S17
MKAKVVKNVKYTEGTIVVEVTRVKMNQKYKKSIKIKKKYLVQWDEKTKLPVDTMVEIVQCAPVSKRKYFRISEVLNNKGVK